MKQTIAQMGLHVSINDATTTRARISLDVRTLNDCAQHPTPEILLVEVGDGGLIFRGAYADSSFGIGREISPGKVRSLTLADERGTKYTLCGALIVLLLGAFGLLA